MHGSSAHGRRLCCSSRRLVDRFAECMDLSTDRSRLDSYFRGSRPAKPAGALSAPPDLQLTPDDADSSDGVDAANGGDGVLEPSAHDRGPLERADGISAPPGCTACRQQSCCGSMDEDESASDGENADLAGDDSGSKVPSAAAALAGPSGKSSLRGACGGQPMSTSSSVWPSAGPSSKYSTRTRGAQAAELAAEAHEVPGQLSAGAKREADGDLADIDLREQAGLMALFEDRRRSSQSKRLLAAATNSTVAAALATAATPPLAQDRGDTAVLQPLRRQLSRSISAPAAAEKLESAECAAKRQRTLRKYFQVRIDALMEIVSLSTCTQHLHTFRPFVYFGRSTVVLEVALLADSGCYICRRYKVCSRFRTARSQQPPDAAFWCAECDLVARKAVPLASEQGYDTGEHQKVLQ